MRIDEVRKTWGESFDGDTRLLDSFEKSIQRFIDRKISINEFVDGINDLDQWAYNMYYREPQKSNWMNIGQNKNYPIIKETVWTAIFEHVRKIAIENTNIEFTLIQGKSGGSVAVAVFEDGTIKTKDVDTGIAIKHPDGFLVPVIAGECKGGHACSSVHDGIWGQAVRMKKQFPNSVQVLITDNQITVGKKYDVSAYEEIDFVISERGPNVGKMKDQKDNFIDKSIVTKSIEIFVNLLSKQSVTHWFTMNPHQINIGETYRSSVDKHGIFISPKHRSF